MAKTVYQKQLSFLKRAVESDKLPHALLFFGRENIGKKEFALDFVKSVINQEINHPDFILLDPEKDIQIAKIRELIHNLCFKPYSAPKKFALVNRAHLMTQESQNCFLKFLEEPPENTHLILITNHPNQLLPTVLSRVQKIRFYLKNIYDQDEKTGLELKEIARADLASRFKIAKSLSEQNIEDVLNSWISYFRKEMISSLPDPKSKKLSFLIRETEETKFLILNTNTNSRLALELLLMKI